MYCSVKYKNLPHGFLKKILSQKALYKLINSICLLFDIRKKVFELPQRFYIQVFK